MWKIILPIVLLLMAAGGGYYYGSQKEPVVIEKVVTKTEIQEKIITRTVIRRPDGTIEETTKEENRKETSKQKEDTVAKGGTGRSNSDYRVGLRYWASSPIDAIQPGWDDAGVSLGRRVIGPVWLDLEANRKQMAMGVSVQW